MKIKTNGSIEYDTRSVSERTISFGDFRMEISLAFDKTEINDKESKRNVSNDVSFFGIVYNYSSLNGFVIEAETIPILIDQFYKYVELYELNIIPITYFDLVKRISENDAPKIMIIDGDEYYWNGEDYEIGIATSLHEEYSLKDLSSGKIHINEVIDPNLYENVHLNFKYGTCREG